MRFQKPLGKPSESVNQFKRTESIKVDGVWDHHLISIETSSIRSL